MTQLLSSMSHDSQRSLLSLSLVYLCFPPSCVVRRADILYIHQKPKMAALMELTWIVSFSLCLLINGKLLRADALVTESITNKETTPEKTKAETTEHIEIHNLTPSVPTRYSEINYTAPYYHEQQVAPKEEPDTGRIAGIIIGVLGGVAIFTTLVAFLLYKHYLRRNVTSMNFDNPVYRKTTEDQFSLEKNQYQPARSYPPSLEPLTSPGTNEFV